MQARELSTGISFILQEFKYKFSSAFVLKSEIQAEAGPLCISFVDCFLWKVLISFFPSQIQRQA